MKIYDFTYPENGITQRKYLIDLQTYRDIVKPLLGQIEDIKELPEKRQDKQRLRELKNELAVVFGGRHLDIFYEMIVETGRYAKAIETGILGPFFVGDRDRPVIIREILSETPPNTPKTSQEGSGARFSSI